MHVLVIDDEPALREILGATVARAGHTVDLAETAKQAAMKLARGDVDVALCDIKLPDGNGITILRDTIASGIETAFIMVTGFGSMETAVDALRAGATDYIVKPVHSAELLHRLSQIGAVRGLREQNQALRKEVTRQAGGLYQWTSPSMREVDRMVSKVAPTDSTVLITGESGTGKGVVARAIHEGSRRRDGPFVVINCSAIPEHLLESEFFGHTKGAFTSADRARKGLFLQADGGTLFLDEIGELPLHMQTKLLHVIEDKMVRAIGSEQSRRVDTRIVTATNRDLQNMAAQGTFREDLYFRLAMFHIRVPPLRERRTDILAFIHHVLDNARRGASSVVRPEPGVEEVLTGYDWPGNVRQLENVVNRALILADGDYIALADLPLEITGNVPVSVQTGTRSAQSGYLRDQVRRFEAEVLRNAIENAGGDRRLAAHRLGIGLSSLYRKLEELERDPQGAPHADV
ncbi:MAG TPA: sigma-54 dependent transcriptional regulator [Burkholderiales bacterium]|nr:sigma-54 dependent transcriptional regulator [Burkholderiales bacterium]